MVRPPFVLLLCFLRLGENEGPLGCSYLGDSSSSQDSLEYSGMYETAGYSLASRTFS